MIRSVVAALLLWLPLPAVADALQLTGEAVQGGLMQGRVPSGSTVLIDGEPVRVSPDGLFLVGFHRDENAAQTVKAVLPDGGEVEQVIAPQPRQYKIERIDGLPPKKVTPPPEALARIQAESAQVKEVRRLDAPRTDFANGFQWPVHGRISGVYGSQRILNGEPRRPHFGIDIAAPTGTPVSAPADGLVTMAHPDMYFSGATLILDHGHGLSSSFLHLDSITVSEGQRVRQGEQIGTVGASGRATGPHLDWRINLFNRRLDPQLLVGPMPKPGSDG